MPLEPEAPPVPFEARLARLEEIVQEMEDSALPLQRMLQLFEEGTVLGKHCQGLLDQAELRIKQVVQANDGSVQLHTFDGGTTSNGNDPAF